MQIKLTRWVLLTLDKNVVKTQAWVKTKKCKKITKVIISRGKQNNRARQKTRSKIQAKIVQTQIQNTRQQYKREQAKGRVKNKAKVTNRLMQSEITLSMFSGKQYLALILAKAQAYILL